MRPALKRFLLPFILGAAIPAGLWGYVAFKDRGHEDANEDELARCQKVASTVKETEGKAAAATNELATCRAELDRLKATSKDGAWFCALPDDSGASACFASRAECERQATACREQSFVVCAGEGRCFSDVWGCVKQATAGQSCETRR